MWCLCVHDSSTVKPQLACCEKALFVVRHAVKRRRRKVEVIQILALFNVMSLLQEAPRSERNYI